MNIFVLLVLIAIFNVVLTVFFNLKFHDTILHLIPYVFSLFLCAIPFLFPDFIPFLIPGFWPSLGYVFFVPVICIFTTGVVDVLVNIIKKHKNKTVKDISL